MKLSARVAYVLIFLFFIFFNGLQVYLIIERIADTRNKFNFACASSMASTLADYHKLKSVDSASMPGYAWIAYSSKKIEINRSDSQRVTFTASSSSLVTDTVAPNVTEIVVNSPLFKSINLRAFDSMFRKSLRAKDVNADYRLDTITIKNRKRARQMVMVLWERKKSKDYAFATSPMPLPYNSGIFIFAQVKRDPDFTRNDLLWPLLAFALILLISNAALVFVYRTISKQKKINELKTDFINNITHEMKTPITIASAGLDALEHHVSPTERTNFYLHTSKKQLHLLNEFVERILEAAVQDVSDFTLKKEKIDLHALFEEIIQSHSLLKGKPIKFQLTGDDPVSINGDRLHLQTAFHNMIDNAIKYSNESVEINIDIVESNRDITIKIRDNGMGIPSQFTNNIFEKFFRVPQGDAQPIKGFGLGLYYVNSIIKKHSGNITVHSKKQSGTEFIITLPKHS